MKRNLESHVTFFLHNEISTLSTLQNQHFSQISNKQNFIAHEQSGSKS